MKIIRNHFVYKRSWQHQFAQNQDQESARCYDNQQHITAWKKEVKQQPDLLCPYFFFELAKNDETLVLFSSSKREK